MSYLEYHSVWLEFNGAWVVLPWCNLTFYSLQFHDYSGLAENTCYIWIAGILWILLGLVLILVLNRSFMASRRTLSFLSCCLALVLQILLAIWGCTHAARPDALTEVYALPISSLLSIAVAVVHYSENYSSKAN